MKTAPALFCLLALTAPAAAQAQGAATPQQAVDRFYAAIANATDYTDAYQRATGVPCTDTTVAKIAAWNLRQADLLPLKVTAECAGNLEALGTTLERYRADHQGHYPAQLSELVPKYLDALPHCPVGDTYLYQNNGQDFLLSCPGHHHADAGQPEGYPQLSRAKGLAARRVQSWPIARVEHYTIDSTRELPETFATVDGQGHTKEVVDHSFQEVVVSESDRGNAEWEAVTHKVTFTVAQHPENHTWQISSIAGGHTVSDGAAQLIGNFSAHPRAAAAQLRQSEWRHCLLASAFFEDAPGGDRARLAPLARMATSEKVWLAGVTASGSEIPDAPALTELSEPAQKLWEEIHLLLRAAGDGVSQRRREHAWPSPTGPFVTSPAADGVGAETYRVGPGYPAFRIPANYPRVYVDPWGRARIELRP